MTGISTPVRPWLWSRVAWLAREWAEGLVWCGAAVLGVPLPDSAHDEPEPSTDTRKD